MHSQRIEVKNTTAIFEDIMEQRISKLFSRLGLSSGKKPLIEGCNYFTGISSVNSDKELACGALSMEVSNQAEWENLWKKHLGIEAPGKLPQGAIAVMVMSGREDGSYETVLQQAARNGAEIALTWNVRKPENAETGHCFSVVVLPAARISHKFPHPQEAPMPASLGR